MQKVICTLNVQLFGIGINVVHLCIFTIGISCRQQNDGEVKCNKSFKACD